MKRLYLTFITALFLCAIAYAKDINVGGFHYRILNDKEVAVIGAEVNDTVLRIPSTVSIQNKQYTVVEVANKKPEKKGMVGDLTRINTGVLRRKILSFLKL